MSLFLQKYLSVYLHRINKKLNILIHVSGSFIFLFLALLSSPDWPDVGRMLSNPMGFRDFVFQVEIILFFYLNYFFLIDRFYFHKKYAYYLLFIAVSYLVIIPFTSFLITQFFPHRPNPAFHGRPGGPGGINGFFGLRVYVFLLVLVFSLLLKIWQHLKKVKEEKTSAELSFLKAQINPHFLFNTLNSIYSLSIQQSKDAPDAILRLSSMMRYVFKETEGEFVELDKEINYINDYIALQKLRMDDQVTLIFSTRGNFSGQKIAPMLVIPFIENAFKYGVNPEQCSTIEISIGLYQSVFNLEVKNTKVNTNFADGAQTHLGLSNTKKRLDLLYPNAYSLSIQDGPADYIVNLSVILT